MAITNGYCTLNEAKQYIHKKVVYTATTISFTASSKVIADTAYGFNRFLTGDIITVSGSTSNNGVYTVATGHVANQIVVTQSLTDEVAGDTVTVQHTVSTQQPIDPSDDARIEDLVEAASRWIDKQTGRTFYGNTETRYFIVGEDTDGQYLYVDKPLLSITSVTNGDGQTIASSEYTTIPRNETPYRAIRLKDKSAYSWDYSDDQFEDAIAIAGSWGYASTAPADIHEACLLLTAILWKRKDAVFGVAGSSALGEIRLNFPKDPHVMSLLSPYKKTFADWKFG